MERIEGALHVPIHFQHFVSVSQSSHVMLSCQFYLCHIQLVKRGNARFESV